MSIFDASRGLNNAVLLARWRWSMASRLNLAITATKHGDWLAIGQQ